MSRTPSCILTIRLYPKLYRSQYVNRTVELTTFCVSLIAASLSFAYVGDFARFTREEGVHTPGQIEWQRRLSTLPCGRSLTKSQTVRRAPSTSGSLFVVVQLTLNFSTSSTHFFGIWNCCLISRSRWANTAVLTRPWQSFSSAKTSFVWLVLFKSVVSYFLELKNSFTALHKKDYFFWNDQQYMASRSCVYVTVWKPIQRICWDCSQCISADSSYEQLLIFCVVPHIPPPTTATQGCKKNSNCFSCEISMRKICPSTSSSTRFVQILQTPMAKMTQHLKRRWGIVTLKNGLGLVHQETSLLPRLWLRKCGVQKPFRASSGIVHALYCFESFESSQYAMSFVFCRVRVMIFIFDHTDKERKRYAWT